MSFDLPTAKQRLSLAVADTSKDVAIQAALSASLAIAEDYCKRRFSFATEVARFYHVASGYLFVSRYPINVVTSVVRSNGQSDIKYKVNQSAGFLDLHGRYSDEEIQVTYSGGYRTLPPDLEYALWGIFNGVWSNMNDVASAGVGGVGQVGITGVGYIRFMADESNSGSKGDPISGYVEAILANYKRYKT